MSALAPMVEEISAAATGNRQHATPTRKRRPRNKPIMSAGTGL